jgi:hypothetical protein
VSYVRSLAPCAPTESSKKRCRKCLRGTVIEQRWGANGATDQFAASFEPVPAS